MARKPKGWIYLPAEVSPRIWIIAETPYQAERRKKRDADSGHTSIQPHVWVRFLRPEGRRAELVLVIDEDTTIEQVRTAWNSLKRMRANLLEAQRNDQHDVQRLVWRLLAREAATDKKPMQMAHALNYSILVLLCRAASFRNLCHSYQTSPLRRNSRYNEHNLSAEWLAESHYLMALVRAILATLRLESDHYLEWVDKIVACLESGEPISPREPWIVDNRQVASIKKKLQASKASGRSVEKRLHLRRKGVDELARAFEEATARAERILSTEMPLAAKNYGKTLLRDFLSIRLMAFSHAAWSWAEQQQPSVGAQGDLPYAYRLEFDVQRAMDTDPSR